MQSMVDRGKLVSVLASHIGDAGDLKYVIDKLTSKVNLRKKPEAGTEVAKQKLLKEMLEASEGILQRTERSYEKDRAIGELLARLGFQTEGRREMGEPQNELQVVMVAMVRKPVEADEDAGIEAKDGEVLHVWNMYTDKDDAEIEKYIRFEQHELVKTNGGPDEVVVKIARPFCST